MHGPQQEGAWVLLPMPGEDPSQAPLRESEAAIEFDGFLVAHDGRIPHAVAIELLPHQAPPERRPASAIRTRAVRPAGSLAVLPACRRIATVSPSAARSTRSRRSAPRTSVMTVPRPASTRLAVSLTESPARAEQLPIHHEPGPGTPAKTNGAGKVVHGLATGARAVGRRNGSERASPVEATRDVIDHPLPPDSASSRHLDLEGATATSC